MEENNSKKFSKLGHTINNVGNVVMVAGGFFGIALLLVADQPGIVHGMARIIALYVLLGSIIGGILLKIPGAIIVLLSDIEYNTRRKQIDQ